MAIGGEIFLDQVREAQQLNMGILTMPTYREALMPNQEANEADWETFKSRMHPLAVIHGDNRESVEYLLTEKSVAWGVEDVNLFAGNAGREVDEISDLTEPEGEEFFQLNFLLAQKLLESNQQPSSLQVNIGFNPEDFSVGHHSIRKLHSHIRVAPHPLDLNRRQQYSWQQLERFDQLAFIEPFASLYHDVLQSMVNEGLFSDSLVAVPEKRLGYSSLLFRADEELHTIFGDLKSMYTRMRDEYQTVANIFTDGTKDPQIDRYIPRPKEERQRLLARFLAQNTMYSEESVHMLERLAARIIPATARKEQVPRDMTDDSKLYITRGFAGAITFTFDKDKDHVRMDFLPRVITTSGVTKTILGEDLPTVIAKTSSPADSEEAEVTSAYHGRAMSILEAMAATAVTLERVA